MNRCHARTLAFVVATVSMSTWSSRARAEDGTAACLSAHENAQLSMQGGKLLDARASLLVCGKESCPKVVRSDCVTMYEENERNVPSVLVQAVDDEGDLIEVTVRLDGKPIVTRLSGAPIEVDPGPHQFSFSVRGKSPIVQTVLIRAAEKNRVLRVSWATPKSTTAPVPVEMERPVPALTYVFAGLGVLGGGGFALFGTKGNSARNDLGQCAPICKSSDVDAVRRDYLIANVSLGVGVAGLVAAGVVYLTRPSRPKQVSTETGPTGLVIVPDRTGVQAGWMGTF